MHFLRSHEFKISFMGEIRLLYSQPVSLPPFCAIASATQTDDSMTGQGQDLRAIGLEVTSEMTATTPMSVVRCVGLVCRAKGSHLATSFHVSSYQ
jgi:hypothetical protein